MNLSDTAGIRRVGGFFLGAALFLSLPVSARAGEEPEGMVKAADNGALSLYLNEEDASVAVMDNQSGKIWYTNPAGIDQDEESTPYYRKMLKSQIQVQYFNEDIRSALMDSYNDSVEKGQFEIQYTEDGFVITYTMRKLEETLLLPEAMSEERFPDFTGRMEGKEGRTFGRNYVLVDMEEGPSAITREFPEPC